MPITPGNDLKKGQYALSTHVCFAPYLTLVLGATEPKRQETVRIEFKDYQSNNDKESEGPTTVVYVDTEDLETDGAGHITCRLSHLLPLALPFLGTPIKGKSTMSHTCWSTFANHRSRLDRPWNLFISPWPSGGGSPTWAGYRCHGFQHQS